MLGFLFLFGVGGVFAARVAHIKAKPFIVDPTESGIVSAAWVAQQGLPDRGKSNHALYLAKDGETVVDAKAGARIVGAAGLVFDPVTFVIGFDFRNDGWSSAKSPRVEVTLTEDPATTYFFGAAAGTQTPVNADWTRVSFTAAQATDADGNVVAMPATGTINSILVVFDEGTDATGGTGTPGFAYLDNLQILDFPAIGKPGNVLKKSPRTPKKPKGPMSPQGPMEPQGPMGPGM
ncbi:MAG: hypothetical protein C4567_11780 [Deltaproteobacteria bacterium]|nr:MAG: hypothetical protein C4567_11780 [Deltaproteobacteria bacterium]